MDYYTSKSSTIKNAKGTFGLSKSRIDDFKILKKFLIEFQGKEIIKIKDVNLDFSNRFINWMIDFKKYASGYAGRMLSVIKTLCNDAKFNGLETHPQLFKVSGYKTKNEYIIVLRPEELESIKDIELPLKSLKNVRKWLLLGCYTGQRAGDLLNITLDNFHTRNDLEVIELKQQKTGNLVTIPVFNKDSKRRELGKYEKWKLISTHTCRRTFCTNNFGRLPNYLIMSVTGHSSEKTFLGYIGKTSYDYAKQFKEMYSKNQN